MLESRPLRVPVGLITIPVRERHHNLVVTWEGSLRSQYDLPTAARCGYILIVSSEVIDQVLTWVMTPPLSEIAQTVMSQSIVILT
jgi:hypothetical protein